jgi:hypothetical protein
MAAALLAPPSPVARLFRPLPRDRPPARQTVYVNGLKMRPLKIIEDSRCPKDAVCVWAGRVVVRTEVIGGAWRRTLDLELGKPQQIADGAVMLVAVHPPKQTGPNPTPAPILHPDFQGGI